ncbi:MAG: hypothetical protein R3B09_11410 [Nannocystaceae bacterium]
MIAPPVIAHPVLPPVDRALRALRSAGVREPAGVWTRVTARALVGLLAGALAVAAGCAPLVRPANFVGARDQVTDVSLVGPFDGQVVDAATGEPIADATVVGVWSYDRGDGFIGPYGSETHEGKTDAAGRYRVPKAARATRGSTVRLVAFNLVIYKRGYVGYRSESTLEGEARGDFAVRHNKIELRKWRESDSHAAHLAYLAPPRAIQGLVGWEQELANLDLYREQGGDLRGAPLPAAGATTTSTPKRKANEWLDASKLIAPAEIRQRTRTQDRFEVEDSKDLDRTNFYHGVHFQAIDRDETHDIAIRIWQAPPGGMKPVVETIEATMPGATKSQEITKQTWTLEVEGVYGVAFVDDATQTGVLLTCGDSQCADLETAILLARELLRNLDRLGAVPQGTPTSVIDAEASTPAPSYTSEPDEDDDDAPADGKPAAKQPAGASPGKTGR